MGTPCMVKSLNVTQLSELPTSLRDCESLIDSSDCRREAERGALLIPPAPSSEQPRSESDEFQEEPETEGSFAVCGALSSCSRREASLQRMSLP